MNDGLTEPDVTRGPRPRAGEMPCEKPLSRPLADAAERDEPRLHVVVGEQGEAVEVDLGTRQAKHVFGLAVREAELEQLALVRDCHALARGKGPHAPGAHA